MWTYRPQLDGLRTVAVYLVLIYHAQVGALSGGFVGVDVFFVLSGFLVTNVILAEVDRTGGFKVGAFYARRVRRLLPAAVLVVVATAVAFVLVTDVARRTELVGDARSALLYYGNWHFLGQSTDYFAQDLKPSPYLHFWSLAIEEQFYLVFPVLLVVLLRARARFTRYAVTAVTVLLAGSVVSQLYWGAHEVNHAYYGTDARLYQLLAGSLLAFALRSRPALLGSRAAAAVGIGGAVLIGLVGSGLLDAETLSASRRGLLATVASVALIAGLNLAPDGWLSRLLGLPVPAYLGKISYGTYLWHWPVILVLREATDAGPWTVAALALVVASALASLSYQVYELPIRTQPLLARGSWGTVVVAVSMSAVVALVAVKPILESPRRPVLAAAVPTSDLDTGGLGEGKVPKLDYAAIARDQGKGQTCAADDARSCIVVPGDGPVVMLVGDSYANTFDPMFRQLAKDHGFTLAENVVVGCPWPEDLEHTGATAAQRADCAEHRDGWYAKALAELKPALVVLIHHQRDGLAKWEGVMKARSGGDETLEQVTLRTMTETVRTISRYAEETVMVQGLMSPNPQFPLECLAAAAKVRDCAIPYPLQGPPSDGYMETLAAQLPGVSTVDVNPVICPTAPVCLTVDDGRAVFRDRLHLTADWGVTHRDQIWKLLAKAGALRGL